MGPRHSQSINTNSKAKKISITREGVILTDTIFTHIAITYETNIIAH